ncbi:hypothetical protein ACSAZK_05870 [Methanosarcina sp. Mfa9]
MFLEKFKDSLLEGFCIEPPPNSGNKKEKDYSGNSISIVLVCDLNTPLST